MSNIFATWEQYIIYLRKSRQDDPRETVEEVLEKHETILQEYAVREFGHKIPERNIYREVVSGESIAEREEIKEVLLRITDSDIKGVLVVEPSRLSRGDLVDCGHLIDALRYSNTEVVTPYMTYDLNNKMERKFFQDELLRGNDYLEYTKEILWRGRVAAAKRGCYISGGPAPFGYKKVKDGKDWILEVVPEDAEITRQIFDWYVRDGLSAGAIAKRLTDMGIPTPFADRPRKNASQRKGWRHGTIRKMLINEHYLGLIVYNRRKTVTVIESGEKTKHRVQQSPEDIIVAKGKHPAIIDKETFERASEMIAPKPKNKEQFELKNVLAGILVCSKCGKPITRSARSDNQPIMFCKSNSPRCFKAVKEDDVLQSFITTLEDSELPALKLKVQNDEGNAIKIQQRVIAKLQDQLHELEEQEENLYELLETKVYTPEMFTRRHTALVAKIENCRGEIEQAKRAMPKPVNYQERAETLEKAISMYKDPSVPAMEKNNYLKTILDRIEYSGLTSAEAKYGENTFNLKFFLRL